MKIIVATRPGGGFDVYGRLLAQTLEKYLPGVKAIIVTNIPGAGHIVGANELYVAKPDGLTIGIFNRSLIMSQIVGSEGIKFDLIKMSWLGSSASDERSFIVAKHTPCKTLDEVVKSEDVINFSCAGVGTMAYMDILLIGKMLGAKNWKAITGYMGAEGEAAMMRGETDAEFMSWSSGKPFVDEGEGSVVMFTASKPVKGYEDVPLLPNLAPAEYKGLVDLMLFLVDFNRPFAGPPGIPADRLKVLRTAFEKSWKDPEMVKLAKKMGRPINYIGGEQAEKLVKGALKQPPEVVKLLKEAWAAD